MLCLIRHSQFSGHLTRYLCLRCSQSGASFFTHACLTTLCRGPQISRKKLNLSSQSHKHHQRQNIECNASSASQHPSSQVCTCFLNVAKRPLLLLQSLLLSLQSADAHKPDDAVQAALRKVNEAVYTAEKQLDKLDKLPSARMPRQVCSLFAAANSNSQAVASVCTHPHGHITALTLLVVTCP